MIVCEGFQSDVREYISRLRALKWQVDPPPPPHLPLPSLSRTHARTSSDDGAEGVLHHCNNENQ